MMQRLKVMVTAVLALLVGVTAVSADPARLASVRDGNLKKPVLVAQDSLGNLYISETTYNVVQIYDRNGSYLQSLSVDRPLGVAVDQSGVIYVCSEKKKRIYIYNPSNLLAPAGILGEAQGDVRSPSITIDKNGNIYVLDNYSTKDGKTRHDTVNVYDSTGIYKMSIGSTGNGDGYLYSPTGLAINDALGEVYIADRYVQNISGKGNTATARVQAFDKTGKYLRTIPIAYGSSVGQISMPMTMAVDKSGKLYVVDSFQRAALIFDVNTGASYSALYDMNVPLTIPLGISIGKDNIAWVTSYNADSVEKYALDGYVSMSTTLSSTMQSSLAFVGQQYGANPATQTITISNSGSGTLNWTASKNQPWLTLGGQPVSTTSVTGTTGPASSSGLAVGVDISSLSTGTYGGSVTITAESGQVNVIPVSLAVNFAPSLSLSPGWLSFSAQKGRNPDPQTVTVSLDNVVSAITWTGRPDVSWASISPATGTTSKTVLVSVNTTSLEVTTDKPYQGTVTFSAPGSISDGTKLTVSLNITTPSLTNLIHVTTNKPDASFSVSSGLSSLYSGVIGTGMTWSMENVPAGNYRTVFGPLAGYKTPLPQTRTLTADNQALFSGNYLTWKELAAKKKIITAKGPWSNNDSLIKILSNPTLTTAATTTTVLTALNSMYGANIAVGDIDGDGIAEIIVGTGAGPDNSTIVRVFKPGKTTPDIEFEAFPGKRGGVNVAAADFDADGKSEIIVAPAGGAENIATVKIFAYDGTKIVPTGIEFTAHTTLAGVNVSAADIDGSFAPRLITAPVSGTNSDPGSVKIWKLDGLASMGSWTITAAPAEIALDTPYGATLAAGDVSGEGKDEIIIGIGSDVNKARVKTYKAVVNDNGSLTITENKNFATFDEKYGVNVAAADLDGDGIVEIIAGVGPVLNAKAAVTTGHDREDRRNKRGHTAATQKTSNALDQGSPVNGTVRIYGADGTLKYTMTPYDGSLYGVKVSAGDLGL